MTSIFIIRDLNTSMQREGPVKTQEEDCLQAKDRGLHTHPIRPSETNAADTMVSDF